MDKVSVEDQPPIVTRQVYCEANRVFAKDDDDRWRPITFHWATVGDMPYL